MLPDARNDKNFHPLFARIVNYQLSIINYQLFSSFLLQWKYHLIKNIHIPPGYIVQFTFEEHFQPHDDRFDGIVARVIQHEYDHTDGVLFIDASVYLSA